MTEIEKDTPEYEFHMEFIPDDRVTLDRDHEQRQIRHLDYLKQRDWFMQQPILYYERSYIAAARMEAHENRMVEIKQRHVDLIKKVTHFVRPQNKARRTGAVGKHALSINASRLQKAYSQVSMCDVSPTQSRPSSPISDEDMNIQNVQLNTPRAQLTAGQLGGDCLRRVSETSHGNMTYGQPQDQSL